ncbi:hypothetical protein QFC19_001573 [Naganishia cerealis]|uniref:Uncharacterized protein n=1 Tax=Naganishia cerealis TaxID=610337 RepID=A0ACC2WIQ6_9TREE|nr:hypothetical protein QFC19_001573 [Naganishia cerealis]
MEREQRRKVRQERRERKRLRELDAARQNTSSLQDGVQDSGTAISSAREQNNRLGSFARRITIRTTRSRTAHASADEIEMRPMAAKDEDETAPPVESPQTARRRNPEHRVRRERTFVTESTSSDASPLPLESVSGVFAYPINAILRYVRYLRSGHEQATKAKVEKRANLRRKVFESGSRRLSANETTTANADPGHDSEPLGLSANVLSGSEENVGWGLGSFGIREAAEGERRLTQAQLLMSQDRESLHQARTTSDSDPEGGGGEDEGEKAGETDPDDDEGFSDIDVERGEGRPDRFASVASPRPGVRSRSRSPTDLGNGDAGRRMAMRDSSTNQPHRHVSHGPTTPELSTDMGQVVPADEDRGSWYWWKPLRKWRMTDKSVY